jgi:HEAT repeat protein
MGLFDYWSKDKQGERKRAAAHKKLTNMYYQKVDRLVAADTMAGMGAEGDDEAIKILLVRFEQQAQNSTIDREEKNYVHDLLVDLGDRAVDVVSAYVRTTDRAVWWPLQVLENVLEGAEFVALLADLLETTDIDYVRNPEKKLGLVQYAATMGVPSLVDPLARFIADHDETVRFNAADVLAKFAGERGGPIFAARLADPEEESGRIRKRLCEALADLGTSTGEHAEALGTRLADGFDLDDTGRVIRR